MKFQLIVLLAVIAISRASPQNAAELSESEGDAVVSINIIIKFLLFRLLNRHFEPRKAIINLNLHIAK